MTSNVRASSGLAEHSHQLYRPTGAAMPTNMILCGPRTARLIWTGSWILGALAVGRVCLEEVSICGLNSRRRSHLDP
jgi:hypothetical protein